MVLWKYIKINRKNADVIQTKLANEVVYMVQITCNHW